MRRQRAISRSSARDNVCLGYARYQEYCVVRLSSVRERVGIGENLVHFGCPDMSGAALRFDMAAKLLRIADSILSEKLAFSRERKRA